MASAAATAGARRRSGPSARGEIRSVEPSEIAWIAAVPCALATVIAVVLLGPPLGDALLRPNASREAFWPFMGVTPEPARNGRFLAGLVGPPLLATVVLASAHPRLRARLRLRAGTIEALALIGQLALIGFVAFCFLAQNDVLVDSDFRTSTGVLAAPHLSYFTVATLVVAALLPALALALLRNRRVEHRLRRLAYETRTRRIACLLAALLYVALWTLTAINVDSSVGNTIEAVTGHLLWTMGETFAVLDGRTPLVDFHAQYGQVWAYLAAAPMALVGATIATYSAVMVTGSTLALLAVYATLRRVVRSSPLALALFVPFVATAAFTVVGPPEDRYSSLNLYILWPIRYAGPCLLVWLTARHVDQVAPRRAWLLFAVVGLVAANSMDFGLAAGAATLVALAFATPPRSWRAARRLAANAAGGVLASLALLSLLTLLRSGSLPHLELLLEFGRLYAIGGWAQLPSPAWGLYLALFLTFAVALVVAAVRVARGDEDRLLTALLAWIGVFGLANGVYYSVRAHPMTLFHFFGPWALAIVLLLVVVARELAARGWRRPTLPQLAALFAFGLVVCSVPQTPSPGPQLARIRERTPVPAFEQRGAVRLVAATTHPGERVLILAPLGHRIAYDAGVVNVSPYTSIESMPTWQQLARALDALHVAGGHKIYLSLAPQFTRPEPLQAIEAAGFVPQRYGDGRQYVEMIDARS